ncbi:MAG: hypothetical protein WAO91_01905 [Candidatus Nitrosotenuis sp.]
MEKLAIILSLPLCVVRSTVDVAKASIDFVPNFLYIFLRSIILLRGYILSANIYIDMENKETEKQTVAPTDETKKEQVKTEEPAKTEK